MPGEGVEPSRCCHRRILSPLRLPFRHPGSVLAPGSSPGAGKNGIIAAMVTVRNAEGAGRDLLGPIVRRSVDWCVRGQKVTASKRGEAIMSDKPNEFGGTYWGKNLDEIDREVARLASICNVRILDPGVIERVLQKDSSVCGSKNPLAFDKLRHALMMHYHLREEAVSQIGEAKTQVLIAEIVERLRARIGDRLGGGTPSQ